MKSPTITIVLLAGMLMLVITTACRDEVSVRSSSQSVIQTASDIADLTLPEKYSPEFTVSLMGYTLVSYTAGTGFSHLYLVQANEGADAAMLETSLDQLVPGTYDHNGRMTVVENLTVSVRGQEALAVISDSVNGEGVAYRQLTVAFEGKSGPAMMVLSEPVDSWNQDAVDSLLSSMQ